jgi:Fic family protein
MPEDSARMESSGIAQADRLYGGFPDFSAWGDLSPEDVDLWNRFAANLAERRREASPETLKAAVEVAVRAAALDTGAIEGLYSVDRGFTMTVAVQGLAWQQMIDERGAGVRELFEAQLAAYELVLDAVTHKLPITEAWIRALHETLCGPQKTYRVLTDQGWQEQELHRGQYKSRPNHVRLTDGTFHAYAPVDRVPDEMHRLMEQIRTPAFEAAHPIRQASYCHYAFVVIHPFADGNGRVARALASTFFYRAQSIPLLIFANQRPAYLDALGLADLKDFNQVISFFLDRGIDTMQLAAESLMTPGTQDLKSMASHLYNASRRQLSLFEQGSDEIATRILKEIDGEIREQIKEADLPKGIEFSLQGAHWTELHGRQTKTHRGLEARLTTYNALVRVRVTVTVSSLSPFSFSLQAPGIADLLEIRSEDVRPEFSGSFKLRLSQWVRRRLAELITELERKIKA